MRRWFATPVLVLVLVLAWWGPLREDGEPGAVALGVVLGVVIVVAVVAVVVVRERRAGARDPRRISGGSGRGPRSR